MRQGFRNKFSTLTLNRNLVAHTMAQQQPETNTEEIVVSDEDNKAANNSSLPELNLTDDLDDLPIIETDQQNTSPLACNKVLLSSSTTDNTKTTAKSRLTELFSSRLYLSDSDNTSYSSDATNDEDDNVQGDLHQKDPTIATATEIGETEKQLEMLKIQTDQDKGAESEDLFSHRTSSEFSLPIATQRYNTNVNVISKQLDNLSLIQEDPTEGADNFLTGTTVPYRSSDFDFSEGTQAAVHIVHQPQINSSQILTGTTVPNTKSFASEKSQNENVTNESIVSISSSSENLENDNEHNSDDNDTDEESDLEDVAVISISDSDEENEEFQTIVSHNQPDNRQSVASSLSSTVVKKLDAFFNNIPLIESLSPNTSLRSSEKISNLNNLEVEEEKELNNGENHESINVDGTPDQSEHNTSSQDKNQPETNNESINVSETPETSDHQNSVESHESDRNSLANDEPDAQNDPSSPKQNVNLQLRPSNGIVKLTPNSQSPFKKNVPTINISAKINIQIQLPDVTSSASDSMSSKSSGNTTFTSEDTSVIIEKPQTPKKHLAADKTNKTPTTRTPQKQLSAEKTNKTPNTRNRRKISPSPKNDRFKTPMDKKNTLTKPSRRSEIDLVSQDILNKLYGNKWQTPELLRKCTPRSNAEIPEKNVRKYPSTEVKLKRQKPQIRDSFANDFCLIRRNVPELDSTRIATVCAATQDIQSTETETNVVLSQHFQMSNDATKSNDNSKILRTNKKKPLAHKIVDSDNSDESDFSSESSDDKWSDYGTSSSSEEDQRTRMPKKYRQVKEPKKKKSTKDKKEKSFADTLIYLDLTNVQLDEDKNHVSPNATENELAEITQKFLLNNLLNSCEFKKKIYTPDFKAKENEITVENTPRTKRKLFTPSQYNYPDVNENDDINNLQTPNPIIVSNEESSPSFQSNVNPKLLIPINRHLETIKMTEIPSPQQIFAKPSLPKTPTLKSKTTNAATPKTPNNASKKYLAIIARDSFFSTRKTFGFLHSLDVRISKENCHPDALPYRNNFKSNRDELKDILYQLYNEKVFDNKLNVPVFWNKKLLKTAGRCTSRKRQGVLSCTIELSDKVVTSSDRLRCTLIHEMCHAATWIFDEATGHGEKWRNWAKRANYVFEELPQIKVCHQYDIQYKYVYICTLCGAKSNAHSKSKKVELIRCAYCHGAIEIFLNKTNKDGTPMPVPVRQASGFAKFVKDKYKDFKNPGVTHSDVMKLLSNAFAELKCDAMGAKK